MRSFRVLLALTSFTAAQRGARRPAHPSPHAPLAKTPKPRHYPDIWIPGMNRLFDLSP